jgi:hypothetical protein
MSNTQQNISDQSKSALENKFIGKRPFTDINKLDKIKFKHSKVEETLKLLENNKPEIKEKLKVEIKPLRSQSVQPKNDLLTKTNTCVPNLSKKLFGDGISKSLNSNLNKLIKKEQQLEANINNKNKQTENLKNNILSGMIKKNILNFELENLKLQLEELKIINAQKYNNSNERNAQLIANTENWDQKLAQSVSVIEQITTKKYQLEGIGKFRDEEINNEILNV